MAIKIIITGGSGMVGSNIKNYLQSDSGFEIVSPSSTDVDLKAYVDVKNLIRQERPDFVIHCAGTVGGIMDNINRPYSFCTDNILMGYNVVEACKECGVDKLINLSSSCIYPPLSDQPFKEDLVLTGPLEQTNEGYALAKTLVMKCIEYSNKQYGTNYKSIIPCNLYGVGDKFGENHSHMIPGVIRRIHEAVAAKKSQVVMWGNPATRREFMYVSDLTNCIGLIIKDYDKCPDVMNIGLGKDYSIEEYYTTIAQVVGFNGKMEVDKSKPVGMKSKLIDSSKVNSIFAWEPKVSLTEGIQLTYDYYKMSLER